MCEIIYSVNLLPRSAKYIQKNRQQPKYSTDTCERSDNMWERVSASAVLSLTPLSSAVARPLLRTPLLSIKIESLSSSRMNSTPSSLLICFSLLHSHAFNSFLNNTYGLHTLYTVTGVDLHTRGAP